MTELPQLDQEYLTFVKESWIDAVDQYKQNYETYIDMKEDCTINTFQRQKTSMPFFYFSVISGFLGIAGIFVWSALLDFDMNIMLWILIPIGITIMGILGIELSYDRVIKCIYNMQQPPPLNPCSDKNFPTQLLPNICNFDMYEPKKKK